MNQSTKSPRPEMLCDTMKKLTEAKQLGLASSATLKWWREHQLRDSSRKSNPN